MRDRYINCLVLIVGMSLHVATVHHTSGAELPSDAQKFDLGLLPEAADLSREFDFINPCEVPATLERITHSCGCITNIVSATPGRVFPKDKFHITCTLDTRGKDGFYNVSLVFELKVDATIKYVTCPLSYTVRPKIGVSLNGLPKDPLTVPSVKDVDLPITCEATPEHLTLSYDSPQDGFFRISHDPTGAPVLRCHLSCTQSGYFHKQICLSNGDYKKTFIISWAAKYDSCDVPVIAAGLSLVGKPDEHVLTLYGIDPQDIVDVEVGSTALDLQYTIAAAKNFHGTLLSMRCDSKNLGKMSADIIIRMHPANKPSIMIVPFSAIFY